MEHMTDTQAIKTFFGATVEEIKNLGEQERKELGDAARQYLADEASRN